MWPRWLEVIRLSEYMDLKTNDKAEPKCASENTPNIVDSWLQVVLVTMVFTNGGYHTQRVHKCFHATQEILF